jgi:hypothetical protein
MLIAPHISLESTPMFRSSSHHHHNTYVLPQSGQHRINNQPETHLIIHLALDTSYSHHNIPQKTKSASSNAHLSISTSHAPHKTKQNKTKQTRVKLVPADHSSKLSVPESERQGKL